MATWSLSLRSRALRRSAIGVAVIAVALLGPLGSAVPAGAATTADLAVAQTVDNSTPQFAQTVTLTTTVTNAGPAQAGLVTVNVPLPNGLTFVSWSDGKAHPNHVYGYNPSTAVWAIGPMNVGAHAQLAIVARAGDVNIGDRTVMATAHSTTPDANAGNNTASVTLHSVAAQFTATLVPAPFNPAVADISASGGMSWSVTATNANDPSAPIGPVTATWFCSTASANDCPLVDGLVVPNQPALTLPLNELNVDIYTVTVRVQSSSPNYGFQFDETSTTFTTTNSGGD